MTERTQRLALTQKLAGVLAVLALLLTSCSVPAATRGDQAAGGAAPDSAKGLPQALPEEGSPVDSGRKIARTASLTVVVSDLAGAALSLRQVAVALGGLVVSENLVTGSTDIEDQGRIVPSTYSTIVLSVPAERLDQALDAAAQVGEVRVRTISAEDVTTQVVDVEARIQTMRESIARVRALMERAGTLTEIANIEAELTRRQADLESLLAQQKALAGMVDQATISISMMTRREVEVASDGFLGGLQAGWEALLASGRVLLTVLGAILPFAVVLALIGGPVWWWIRRRARGRAGSEAETHSGPDAPRAEGEPPNPPSASDAANQDNEGNSVQVATNSQSSADQATR